MTLRLLLFLSIPFLAARGQEAPAKPVAYWRLPGYLQKGSVEQLGGRVIEMPEFNSLWVLYLPRVERFKGTLVYLPSGLPYESLAPWKKVADEQGVAFVSVLSWQGNENYLSAEKIDQLLEALLGRLKEEYSILARRSIVWGSRGDLTEALYQRWLYRKEPVKLVVIPKNGRQETNRKPKVYALYCGEAASEDPTRCGSMHAGEVIKLMEDLR